MKTSVIPGVALMWAISMCSTRANLGETFSQINARYGQPIRTVAVGDPATQTYYYQFNSRRIYVEFMNGKSASEAILATADQPVLSEELCLAFARQISGETNWTELSRREGGIVWMTGDATATLNRIPGHPDSVFVSTIKLDMHQIESMDGGGLVVRSATNAGDAGPAARILKYQQDLAERGDRYGEYQMGLRYFNGDGVPRDLQKARELLQKAAGQEEDGAAAALAKVNMAIAENGENAAYGVIIQSAEFGTTNKMADVTTNLAALLRDQPDGFSVNAEMLRVDPVPGKKKVLTVRYSYKGTNAVLTVAGGKGLSVLNLIRHAAK